MSVFVTFASAAAFLLLLFVFVSRIKRRPDQVGKTYRSSQDGASGGSGDVNRFEWDCGGSDAGGGDGD